ncbi:MAG: P-II family nitrogen regulator [Actinomycetota bacterium]|jgi:nitrogen regulatory protein PII|nr:P-II family nitrogen regulator [Actinomycetota bacterium]
MEPLAKLDLIVTIIPKGQSDKIVKASKRAGAEGGTIIYGRGTGIHEHKKLFGLAIEPEKEIILTLVPEHKTDEILEAIVEAGELDKPGTGVGFVLDTKKIVGINHLIEAME